MVVANLKGAECAVYRNLARSVTNKAHADILGKIAAKEQGEHLAQGIYASMKSIVPDIEDIIKDEEKHEIAVLSVSITAITFLIGMAARTIFGISV